MWGPVFIIYEKKAKISKITKKCNTVEHGLYDRIHLFHLIEHCVLWYTVAIWGKISNIKSRNTRDILYIGIKWGMSIWGFRMVMSTLGFSSLDGLQVLGGFHFMYIWQGEWYWNISWGLFHTEDMYYGYGVWDGEKWGTAWTGGPQHDFCVFFKGFEGIHDFKLTFKNFA